MQIEAQTSPLEVTMGDLRVSVRWQGRVVEDRVLDVRGGVRIGDEPESAVPFPGASILIEREGPYLVTRGHRLAEGDQTSLCLGSVSVLLEHQAQERALRPMALPFDVRFGFMAMAVIVGSMWVDAAGLQVGAFRHASVAVEEGPRGKQEAADSQSVSGRPTAQPEDGQQSPASFAADGREALPDDAETRWAFYTWYRRAVPNTLDAQLAMLQLASSPEDAELKGLAARGAYDNDDWRGAFSLYAELVSAQPKEVRWLEGLGLAQKRLGLHRAELATWARVLELDPRHIMARGGKALAMARLGDYDAAVSELDRLRVVGGDHPYVDVFLGMVLAIQGDEPNAVLALEQGFMARGRMPAALQLELRRDLALDPALKALRSNRELRAMLYRHIGAAAPRPYR